MPWDRDDWLLDRKIRGDWLRSVALSRLAEMILRTPATAAEALMCVLDEVFGRHAAATSKLVAQHAGRDLAAAAEWLHGALGKARTQRVQFQSAALVLPDSAPYRFEIVLVNGPVHGPNEWFGKIVWRSRKRFTACVLTELQPVLESLARDRRRQADHIVPLAYSAFLLRDAINARSDDWRGVRQAIVIYDGGDSLRVPMGAAPAK